MNKIKSNIPNILSILRIIFSPLLFLFILLDFGLLAIILFIYCIISDKMDGYIARELDVCSNFGGYLDVVADFTFVFLALYSLVIKLLYPFWILIVISLFFIQFLFTSSTKRPVYDPLGKYYGAFLMMMVGIALIDYFKDVLIYIPVFLLCYTLLAVISRMVILVLNRKK